MHFLGVSLAIFAVFGIAIGCELKCPDGYLSFSRTPSDLNLQTSLWCVKPIFSEDPINVTTARALCAKEAAVLTTFENDAERQQIIFQLKNQLAVYKQSVGSIIVDGHRLEKCQTQDSSILGASPCNSKTDGFVLDDKHTDPTFMFQHWADTEPSGTFYQSEIESCIQLSISAFPLRNTGINDYLCNYPKPPQNPSVVETWNFGAVCGRLPEFQ